MYSIAINKTTTAQRRVKTKWRKCIGNTYIILNKDKEYTEEIEPIYMACDLPTKEDFIKAFNETFERIVYPIVENTISNFSTEEKLAYLYSFRREEMDESVRMFDRKARQIAYDYMKLYLMVVV